MKMKAIHQNARKVNYYARMFTKELLDEIEFVIKSNNSSESAAVVPKRLTKTATPSDNLPSYVDALKSIHAEKDDDTLHAKLTQFISTISNSSLSSLWMSELSSCVRFRVPDEKVPWSVSYPDYKPAQFTAWPVMHTSLDPTSPKPPWADEDFMLKSKEELESVKFNKDDELNGKKIDRKSRECKYDLDPSTGLPLNPRGRTGMVGRGLLGRFGPNLAADPIVSRFKKLADGSVKCVGDKPVLECVFVQRRDNHEWAIPGGMVEPGTAVSLTLVKEFREEALNVCNNDQAKAEKMTNELKESLFSKGFTIYEGYVDDPRNTDNAWMETVAKNFHDEKGITYTFQLQGGDDAFHSKWQECSSQLKLYASHKNFIERTVQRHNAHW